MPQFSDKYLLQLIIADSKEDETVAIIKRNGREGKIFISQILRAVDVATDAEGEDTI